MRKHLSHLAIGLASALASVGTPPHSSSATLPARSRILAWPLLSLALVSAGWAAQLKVGGAPAAASPASLDWPAYLGDKGRSLYSPLRQINRTNVARLKIAWTYDTGDKGEYQANNLIVAGVLYTASPTRKVIALEAATGRELWQWGRRCKARWRQSGCWLGIRLCHRCRRSRRSSVGRHCSG